MNFNKCHENIESAEQRVKFGWKKHGIKNRFLYFQRMLAKMDVMLVIGTIGSFEWKKIENFVFVFHVNDYISFYIFISLIKMSDLFLTDFAKKLFNNK